MRQRTQSGWRRAIAAMVCAALVAPASLPAQDSLPRGGVVRVENRMVLTNVIVRDKRTGELVRGLKQSDFSISENNKPQRLETFDFEDVTKLAVEQPEQATVSGELSATALLNKIAHPSAPALRDHRLLVMFFDLSSMQVDDLDRAVLAAQEFIKTKMEPADLVALVSMSTALKVDQDFTADKDVLLKRVGVYNGTEGTGLEVGSEGGGTDATSDDSSSYVPDDSEYNALNTDRELYAIRTIAQSLARVDQRKSLLYFSGGLTRNGIENEAALREAVGAAMRANISIYSVDTRGLQALPPVGDASKGSLRGKSAYSGAAMQAQLNGNFSSQETLATLSTDTGGTAFFDSNNFAPAFQKAQADSSAYYILGYHATNAAKDGSFRRLTVKVNRPDVKLEYRTGYYAPVDFQHAKSEDRELQLTQQLESDMSATDVSVYLQALYFRQDAEHYVVPVSLVVPGSQIPFNANGDRDKATLDVAGVVKNGQGLTVGGARETVKLAFDQAQQARSRNIQYQTEFALVPGSYHLKFVVRENQTGRMGTFETRIQVPDLKKAPLKMSSVVLSSQQTQGAAERKHEFNPLIRDGAEWVPNVPHVFRQDQHLYVLYEVYDPAKNKQAAAGAGPVRVLTSIEFLTGGVKVYETPLVAAESLNVPERGAAAFQFDVPLEKLKPGLYTVQVNVVDDAAGSFSFPRASILIQPPAAPVSAPAPASTPAAAAPAQSK